MSGERASFDDDDSKDELIQQMFDELVTEWVARDAGYSIDGINDIFLDTLTTQTMWVKPVGEPTLVNTDLNVQYAQESLSSLREQATEEARLYWLDEMGAEYE